MLNILYVNCCGLVNKLHFPEFENLVEKHSIVCFVETKTDDMDEIKLPGYIFHMKNRKTNSRVKSGGIIIVPLSLLVLLRGIPNMSRLQTSLIEIPCKSSPNS
jgi:hypothetical protein